MDSYCVCVFLVRCFILGSASSLQQTKFSFNFCIAYFYCNFKHWDLWIVRWQNINNTAIALSDDIALRISPTSHAPVVSTVHEGIFAKILSKKEQLHLRPYTFWKTRLGFNYRILTYSKIVLKIFVAKIYSIITIDKRNKSEIQSL